MLLPASAEVEIGTSAAEFELARSALEEALGFCFADPDLLLTALSHRSWCAENGGSSNERLEFLGDAVIGLLIAEHVYSQYPQRPEGELAKIRSGVISACELAKTARSLSLGDALRLGAGENKAGGRDKDSILSDAIEAVLGAVYLDGGHQAASRIARNLFEEAVTRAAIDPGVSDYKTRLQELVVSRSGDSPRYRLSTDGPDHEKRFYAAVEVAGNKFGPASGTSKKRAEQAAAQLAYESLCDEENGENQ
jgi:ribonuclease-3